MLDRQKSKINLLGYLTSVFAMQTAMASRGQKAGKRHPLDDKSTGPDAATTYRYRRDISRSRGSSLRKLDRETRIFNGTAQLRYGVPTNRERITANRAARRALVAA